MLSSPEKRARYDRFGHAENLFDGFGAGFSGTAINDIFGDEGNIFPDQWEFQRQYAAHGGTNSTVLAHACAIVRLDV